MVFAAVTCTWRWGNSEEGDIHGQVSHPQHLHHPPTPTPLSMSLWVHPCSQGQPLRRRQVVCGGGCLGSAVIATKAFSIRGGSFTINMQIL